MVRTIASGALALCLPVAAALAEPLSLTVRGHDVREPVFSVFAQPGETIPIGNGGRPLVIEQDGKPLAQPADNGMVITAPQEHGHYQLRLGHPDDDRSALLNVWVAIPKAKMEGEYLNGYRIGNYPPPRKNRPNYEPPEGFFEVTAENVDTPVSTNFTLRQFLCKQEADYPKYVVIQESLLVLLERLLVEVQGEGFDIDTFGIISGYRTPYYNKRIGNVPYSRHVYGDAMDFFIDVDGDGLMDDIDGDGMRNAADIQKFFHIVDRFKAQKENRPLMGGIGRYNKTSRHGGFVHADTRGYLARW